MADNNPTPRASISLSFDSLEPWDLQSDESLATLVALDTPKLMLEVALQLEGAEGPHVPLRVVALSGKERGELHEHLWHVLMALAERHGLIDPDGDYETRLEASLSLSVKLYPDADADDPERALLAALEPREVPQDGPGQAEESGPPHSSGTDSRA